MEWIIIILVVGAIYYGMYRLALSKNRNPWNWILPSILISPVILISITGEIKIIGFYQVF